MSRPGHADPPPSWLSWLPETLRDRVAGNRIFQKIIQNTGWLMLERIGQKGIRFFVGVWMIRYLGPENYGVYSYALSFVAISETFTTLGLKQIIIRECSGDEYDDDVVIVSAFWMQFVAAAVVFAVVAFVILQFEDDWLIRTAVFIISARMFFRPFRVSDSWFQSKIRAKYSVYVRTFAMLVASGMQVAAILLEASVLFFVIILLAQFAIQAIGFIIAFNLYGPALSSWRPSAPLMQELLGDSWPLMIDAFSTMVYMKVDQLMLENMVGRTEVGLYATGVKLSELWYFLPSAIAASVFPEIVRSRETLSAERYRDRLQKFYDAMALLAYTIAIPVTFVAPYVVRILFGAEYSGTTPMLQIHVWSFLFIALGLARGKWLVTENLTQFAMAATVSGAILNIALNVYLIPIWGGIGASWATLMSYTVYAYIALAFMSKTRGTFFQLSKAIVSPVRYIPKFIKS